MNKVLILAVLIGLTVGASAVEMGYWSRPDGASVWEGELIVLEAGDRFNTGVIDVSDPFGEIPVLHVTLPDSTVIGLKIGNLGLSTGQAGLIGPCTVFPDIVGNYRYIAYHITRAVPEGSGQLIIETSEDLIEWTPAYTGVIDMTDPTEFFRARIVNP
jgi:hypothetical protein